MTALNTTINSRTYSTVIDQYGVDPLRDKTIADIVNIPTYGTYIVTQDERGRPDLVSYKSYRTVHLWWVILLYNKLYSYRDIVEGTILKIPTVGQVIKSLSKNSSTSVNTFVI